MILYDYNIILNVNEQTKYKFDSTIKYTFIGICTIYYI